MSDKNAHFVASRQHTLLPLKGHLTHQLVSGIVAKIWPLYTGTGLNLGDRVLGEIEILQVTQLVKIYLQCRRP